MEGRCGRNAESSEKGCGGREDGGGSEGVGGRGCNAVWGTAKGCWEGPAPGLWPAPSLGTVGGWHRPGLPEGLIHTVGERSRGGWGGCPSSRCGTSGKSLPLSHLSVFHVEWRQQTALPTSGSS